MIMTYIQHNDLLFLCILVFDDKDLLWIDGLDTVIIVQLRFDVGFVYGAAIAYHIDFSSITGFFIEMRPFNSKVIFTLFDICVQDVLDRLKGIIIQKKGSCIVASFAATKTVGYDVKEIMKKVIKKMVKKMVIEKGVRTRRKREKVFSIFRITAV